MKGISFLRSKVPLRKRQKATKQRSEQCKQNEQSCISGKAVPTRCATCSWRTHKTNGLFKRNGGGAVPHCRATLRQAIPLTRKRSVCTTASCERKQARAIKSLKQPPTAMRRSLLGCLPAKSILATSRNC